MRKSRRDNYGLKGSPSATWRPLPLRVSAMVVRPIDNAADFDDSEPRGRTRRSGFSLLEVMIATGILATSAFLLLSLISSGATFGNKAEQLTEAMILCNNRMAETEWMSIEELNRTDNLQLCPESDNWAFRRTVEPLNESGLHRVVVEVFSSEQMEELPVGGADRNQRPAARLVQWVKVSDRMFDPSPSSPRNRF